MKNTLTLLRLPFSFFLMPVFLFALSQATVVKWEHAFILFLVLHVLVYPSSNAYNSYMDQDESSIGGLKNPPKATRSVYLISIILDIAAVLISLFISAQIALGMLLYITASRLYSYRKIRIKQFAVSGWLTVVIFQGGFTYWLTQMAIGQPEHQWLAVLASSMLIGGIYPLTQIYQFEADAKDGVKTISMLLGYKGTFIFTIVMFALANLCLWFHFDARSQTTHFGIITLLLIPVVVYFLKWLLAVWKNTTAANFEHTMRMNLIASSCLNGCYALLIYLNHFS
ncbi:MAG: UbiA family prenyltransferase [Bacteroidia bacterium]|jgi:1,4-dihydroxy-2-naphthoate octaprenyltransferase|nr:UbiA family prenyltransferase [Bacteroidia bacterium]